MEDEEELKTYTNQILNATDFNTMMLLLQNELKWDKSEVQWIKILINLKPNKSWTNTIQYKCTEFKITRNGGLALHYDSTEFNYWVNYYYKSVEGPYTKIETIEKLNKVIGLLNDPKYMKKLNKKIAGYHWSRVDINKKGFLGIF